MDFIKQENPWDVTNIEEFLYYCCPECDTKCKDGETFIEHATNSHDLAKVSLAPYTEDFSNFEPEVNFEPETNFEPEVSMAEPSEEDTDIKPDLDELKPVIIQDEPKPKKPRIEAKVTKHKSHKSERGEKTKCEHCGNSYREINIHLRSAHPEKLFKCSKCDFVTVTEDFLKKHYNAKHVYVKQADGLYHCDFCDYKAEGKAGIKQHRLYKHIQYGRFKCDICEKICRDSRDLDTHKKFKHSGELPFMCDKCDYRTATIQNLNAHKKRHDPVKEVCYICGKAFQQLKAHIERAHTNDSKEEVVCDICGKTVRAGAMAQHMSNVHNKNKVCTICDKVIIGGKRKLVDHLSNEHQVYAHENDIFVCHLCRHKCFTSKDLHDHLLKQHEMKNDQHCEKCEILYPTKSLLAIHLMDCHTYTPVKVASILGCSDAKIVEEVNTNPFPCQHCDKKFASYRTLFGHVKQVHDKSSHVKCDHCDFSTYDNYKMKRHVLSVHTKAYKFPCDKCSFITNLQSVLSQHIKTVHEKSNSIGCQECGKDFQSKNRLAEHMLKEHNIIYKYSSALSKN